MAHVTAGSLGKIKGGASRSKVGARPPGAPPKAVTRPDPDVGLTDAEVAERRATFGANALVEERRGLAKRLLVFFWGPIPWMIEVAAILSAVVRHWEDLAIIGTMLILNAVVGFWQEYKADTTIEALKQRLALRARVLRAGRWTEVEASELVPGDVVMVRLGKIVPADIALEGDGFLSVDQSALTGESLPVTRKGGDTIYSGSVVRMGEMRGFVVAIGMDTYFGRTARLVETAETRSHFQKAVIKIGNFLIFVTLALVAVIVTVRAVPARAPGRHAHVRADPDGGGDPRRPAGGALGDHGRGRQQAGAHEGDRVAPGVDRRAGGHGHPLLRQDRHADQERAHARRSDCRRRPRRGGAAARGRAGVAERR